MLVCSCLFVRACLFVLVCSCLFVRACLFVLVCSCLFVRACLFVLVCSCLFVRACLFVLVCFSLSYPNVTSQGGSKTRRKWSPSWKISGPATSNKSVPSLQSPSPSTVPRPSHIFSNTHKFALSPVKQTQTTLKFVTIVCRRFF